MLFRSAQAPAAERDTLPAANDEDVCVVGGEGPQAGLHFLCVGRNRVGLQDKALGVCELGTPTSFVLHDCAPQVNLAVDSELFVAALVQVLNCLRRVHAAGAVGLRRLVGIMHSLRTPSDGSDDYRSPASRR